MSAAASALPALPPTADIRSITERVNVLIRDYNNQPVPLTGMKVTSFTASGTFTPDTKCVAGYAVGKGGGGGSIGLAPGASAQGGGGGSAGNKVTKFFVKADVAPNVTVTIGAGGGGANGGDTTFGSLLTAKGGVVGSFPTGATATATGNVGDIIELGEAGGTGMYAPNTNFATGGSGGGNGGGAGAAAGGSAAAAGTPGLANSGGGAGGAAANTANAGGSTGGSGYLYVVELLGAP